MIVSRPPSFAYLCMLYLLLGLLGKTTLEPNSLGYLGSTLGFGACTVGYLNVGFYWYVLGYNSLSDG